MGEGREGWRGGGKGEKMKYSTHSLSQLMVCTHMYGLAVWQSEEMAWGTSLLLWPSTHNRRQNRKWTQRERERGGGGGGGRRVVRKEGDEGSKERGR